MYRLHLYLGAWTALLWLGCGGQSGTPSDSGVSNTNDLQSGSALPLVKTVLPQTTDPNIGAPNLSHTYAAPSSDAAWNGKLLVFFPGSLAYPTEYQLIVQQAAAIGYYAVGVSYPNGAPNVLGKTLSEICDNNIGGTSSGFDCYGQVRLNRFNGSPEPNGSTTNPPPSGAFYDPYFIASPANAIEHRLGALLRWLSTPGHATAGQAATWAQFVNSTTVTPIYSKIVFAGHSQGGGEAAYIAKVTPVVGVVMFSSPEDAAVQNLLNAGSLTTGSAAWLSDGAGFQTPLSCFYGFTHEQDEFVPRIEAAWDVLASGSTRFAGFSASCADAATGPAAPASIDYAVGSPAPLTDPAPCYTTSPTAPLPPYGGAHRLYTNTSDVSGLFKYHDSTVVDSQTPLCPTSSNPLLMPVWRQMLYGAGGFNTIAPAGC